MAFCSSLRASRGVVLASLSEGFGLPAIEALAIGRPVLGSRDSVTTDLCGELCVAVDPYDIASIRRGLERLFCDDELLERAANDGPDRVRKLSAEHVGRPMAQPPRRVRSMSQAERSARPLRVAVQAWLPMLEASGAKTRLLGLFEGLALRAAPDVDIVVLAGHDAHDELRAAGERIPRARLLECGVRAQPTWKRHLDERRLLHSLLANETHRCPRRREPADAAATLGLRRRLDPARPS